MEMFVLSNPKEERTSTLSKLGDKSLGVRNTQKREVAPMEKSMRTIRVCKQGRHL